MKGAITKEMIDEMNNTIKQLEKEKNTYMQCNERLTKELNYLLDANEKLLFSFKDRYHMYMSLSKENAELDDEINEQMDKIEQYSISKNKFIRIVRGNIMNPTLSRATNDLMALKKEYENTQNGDFQLLDHIIQLQQEKEKLQQDNEELQKIVDSLIPKIPGLFKYQNEQLENRISTCEQLRRDIENQKMVRNKQNRIKFAKEISPKSILNLLDMAPSSNVSLSSSVFVPSPKHSEGEAEASDSLASSESSATFNENSTLIGPQAQTSNQNSPKSGTSQTENEKHSTQSPTSIKSRNAPSTPTNKQHSNIKNIQKHLIFSHLPKINMGSLSKSDIETTFQKILPYHKSSKKNKEKQSPIKPSIPNQVPIPENNVKQRTVIRPPLPTKDQAKRDQKLLDQDKNDISNSLSEANINNNNENNNNETNIIETNKENNENENNNENKENENNNNETNNENDNNNENNENDINNENNENDINNENIEIDNTIEKEKKIENSEFEELPSSNTNEKLNDTSSKNIKNSENNDFNNLSSSEEKEKKIDDLDNSSSKEENKLDKNEVTNSSSPKNDKKKETNDSNNSSSKGEKKTDKNELKGSFSSNISKDKNVNNSSSKEEKKEDKKEENISSNDEKEKENKTSESKNSSSEEEKKTDKNEEKVSSSSDKEKEKKTKNSSSEKEKKTDKNEANNSSSSIKEKETKTNDSNNSSSNKAKEKKDSKKNSSEEEKKADKNEISNPSSSNTEKKTKSSNNSSSNNEKEKDNNNSDNSSSAEKKNTDKNDVSNSSSSGNENEKDNSDSNNSNEEDNDTDKSDANNSYSSYTEKEKTINDSSNSLSQEESKSENNSSVSYDENSTQASKEISSEETESDQGKGSNTKSLSNTSNHKKSYLSAGAESSKDLDVSYNSQSSIRSDVEQDQLNESSPLNSNSVQTRSLTIDQSNSQNQQLNDQDEDEISKEKIFISKVQKDGTIGQSNPLFSLVSQIPGASNEYVIDRYTQTKESRQQRLAAFLHQHLKEFERVDEMNELVEEAKRHISSLDSDISNLNNQIISKDRKTKEFSKHLTSYKGDTFTYRNFSSLPYVDDETNTEDIELIEELKTRLINNSDKTTKLFLQKQQKKELESLLEQKDIELKLKQMAYERKTADLKSLLYRLKIVDPLLYSEEIQQPVYLESDPNLEAKREKRIQKLSKLDKRIKLMEEEISNNESQVQDLLHVNSQLQNELHTLSRMPRSNVKSLCETLKQQRAIITENIRQLAFVRHETEYVNSHISKLLDLYSENELDNLRNKVDQQNETITKLKSKFNTMRGVKEKRRVPLTIEDELMMMHCHIREVSGEIDVSQMKKNSAISKVEKLIRTLTEQNIRIPEPPPTLQLHSPRTSD